MCDHWVGPRRWEAAAKENAMARVWAAGAGAVLSVALAFQAAAGAEALRSGLVIGAKTKQFDVLDVTGPTKGKQTCYV